MVCCGISGVVNSILMTRHSPDLGGASDWLEVCFTDPTRSTTQIWVVTRHQYGFLRSFLRLHAAENHLWRRQMSAVFSS